MPRFRNRKSRTFPQKSVHSGHFARTPGTMKTPVLAAIVLTVLVSACHGPGGPATRTGRAVDNAVYHVGHGIEKTGDAIEDVATGN